jgi:outer membrane receptor protein involved in Fe transport
LDKEKSHNIRASTQTAFRFPATADQWLNLSLGQMDINGKQFTFRVIGGNEEVHEAYNITNENVFALSGNNPFIGIPESEPFQVPVFRPETVTALEIGYKGLYFDKVLFVDTYFFHNTYNSFHAKQALAQNPGTANENRYITTISTENPVVTYGWAVGADMMMPGGFLLKGNLMNNTIDLGENNTSGFQSRFNTPAYKINISLVNYHVLQNLGFSVSWRWQDSFNWESDFGKTVIPSYNTIDAQVSLKLPQWSSVVKVGGSNLLNQYYATGLGNSAIGGLYYVSVTFDEFLN